MTLKGLFPVPHPTALSVKMPPKVNFIILKRKATLPPITVYPDSVHYTPLIPTITAQRIVGHQRHLKRATMLSRFDRQVWSALPVEVVQRCPRLRRDMDPIQTHLAGFLTVLMGIDKVHSYRHSKLDMAAMLKLASLPHRSLPISILYFPNTPDFRFLVPP